MQGTLVQFLGWEDPLEDGQATHSCGLDSKESTCNVGDLGSIPGLGRSPGGGHGNPLQDSCRENPMDREAFRAAVRRVAELDTT